jgi:NTE family protein
MRCLKILLIACLVLNSGCAQHPLPDFILLPDNPPPALQLENVRVAVVLSGGGARALAHAGVLEVLEQHKIPIDLIVGSSAGSIIGALYADEPHAHNMKNKVIALNKWDLLDLNWFASVQMLWRLTGPVEGNAIKLFVQKNIRAKDFNQLKIPLAVVTTDANKGEAFVIRSGPLAPALHASSAIPMLFNPVRIYGKTLVDGGVASPVPVEVAKQFSPKIIIAVDIGTSPDYGPINTTYQLAMRSLHISYFKLSKFQTAQADIVIHPAIDQFGMFDDHANEEMYEAGRTAAMQAIPEIQKALTQL